MYTQAPDLLLALGKDIMLDNMSSFASIGIASIDNYNNLLTLVGQNSCGCLDAQNVSVDER